MKKIIKYLAPCLLVFIFFLMYSPTMDAGCSQCDDYLNTGHCDKKDVNNKKCVIPQGGTIDCYQPGCSSGGDGGWE